MSKIIEEEIIWTYSKWLHNGSNIAFQSKSWLHHMCLCVPGNSTSYVRDRRLIRPTSTILVKSQREPSGWSSVASRNACTKIIIIKRERREWYHGRSQRQKKMQQRSIQISKPTLQIVKELQRVFELWTFFVDHLVKSRSFHRKILLFSFRHIIKILLSFPEGHKICLLNHFFLVQHCVFHRLEC
jgi:hypothetical protein